LKKGTHLPPADLAWRKKHLGGALIGAFLARSAGYVVADRPFPVLSLSAESIETVFAARA
jgi:hypothetical protein